MTDPNLAALTEALRDNLLLPGWEDEVGFEGLAGRILAHPAMADFARKAAAWDVVERLEWNGEGSFALTYDDGYYTVSAWTPERNRNDGRGPTLDAAIAAALEQDG